MKIFSVTRGFKFTKSRLNTDNEQGTTSQYLLDQRFDVVLYRSTLVLGIAFTDISRIAEPPFDKVGEVSTESRVGMAERK